MIKSLKQNLMQKCCRLLNESLKQQEAAYLADLATYIVLLRSSKPLPDVIEGIFQLGVSPSELLRALMKCQWLILEAKLSELAEVSPKLQMQGIKATIEHFHYIEVSVVEMGEGIWVRKLDDAQKSLEDEREARIVATTLQQWSSHDKVKLLNYYKGLPVQVMAKIVDVVGGVSPTVTVEVSKELSRVLAISEKKMVLTPDVEDKLFVQLSVLRIWADKVTFCLNGLADIERRKQFRLEPLKSISIDILQHKKLSDRGVLLDISLTHVDLRISDAITFKLDEIIDFSFQMEASLMKGAAWVRFIRVREDCQVICLELMPDGGLQRLFQQQIAVLQRKIIQEIRLKFTVQS